MSEDSNFRAEIPVMSWERMTAEDVMSSPVIALNVDAPLAEVLKTLGEHQMSGALVTDHRGAPVGVVSLFDVVTHLSGLERPPEEPGGFYRYSYPRFGEGGEGWESGWEEIEGEPLKEITAGEIMSTEIISVPRGLTLADVAKLLAKRRIHRVFVAGDNGPAGVVSAMDMLRAISGVTRPKAHA